MMSVLRFHSWILFLFLDLLTLGNLRGFESQPLKVLAIEGPLRISVEASLGGVPMTQRVQLQYLSLPRNITDEQNVRISTMATDLLKKLVPPGTMVRLLDEAGDKLVPDPTGAVKAIVCYDVYAKEAKPGSPVNTPISRVSVQFEMIKAGVAMYWDKDGAAPYPLNLNLQELMSTAQSTKQGWWGIQP